MDSSSGAKHCSYYVLVRVLVGVMTRLILSILATPLIVATAILLLLWGCFSGVFWHIDKTIDKVFEDWI